MHYRVQDRYNQTKILVMMIHKLIFLGGISLCMQIFITIMIRVLAEKAGFKPDGLFDPVCTAHEELMYVTGIHPEAQARTYIPFHFIPEAKYNQVDEEYDYRTRPNGKFAQDIVGLAMADLSKANQQDIRVRKLIKPGIALHSYADTWAHQQFSGRFDTQDNYADVNRIYTSVNGDWHKEELKITGKTVLGTPIGHARVLDNPDRSYLK